MSASRPQRWATAVAEAQRALGVIQDARDEFERATEAAVQEFNESVEVLKALREEYEEWQGNLPESMAQSETAARLEGVTSIEFSEIDNAGDATEVATAEAAIETAGNVDLPRGFGRD